MDKLTTKQLKERIESAFPELVLGRESETGQIQIISKESWRVVAYVYHQKWVLKASISDYSLQIAAIINLLEKWDGVRD